MSQERSFAALRAEIDGQLEALLEPTAGDGFPRARETVAETDDRWYGLLLALSYDSVAETADTGAVVPAAAAVELLRGYCRLRGDLLGRIADSTAGRSTHEPTAALLAGDYLYAAAYSSLGSVDDAVVGDCFETLVAVSGTVVEAFGSSCSRSGSSTTDHCSYVDETAGSLGEGAATIGATLAGADDAVRDSLAVLGRGLGTSRRIRRALDSGADAGSGLPPAVDEGRLRRHARQRLDEVDRALSALPSTADVEHLRTLRPSVDSG